MEQKQYTVFGDYNQLLTANYNLSKKTYKYNFLIKANKEYFSEQIKLDTLWNLLHMYCYT